jgi:hypothetical protein
MSRRRRLVADLVGLGFLLFLLVDFLRPSLLLISTITAGGDTPCHYPTAAEFSRRLLPQLRLHGWYSGAYLGQPLLLYYFPLAFLVMAGFAPFTGLPVAFKLGTALGIYLLPLAAYACFRLLGFRFPGPLLAAGAATVFLFLEDNPIWGGTMASTLTGEFSYTYGIGLGVLFLGVVYHSYSRGRTPWLPAAVLAVTALAHGYAVLWAGLSAAYFLYAARRPLRTLVWLAGVAAGAFALVGFWVLPLLSDWGWTTPYADPWITVTSLSLVPQLLWPLIALAGLGLAGTLFAAGWSGGPDHRLLFLLHAGLVGAALAAAGPALGIIDVRFVPLAQLSLCLAGAGALTIAVQDLAAADLAAIGVVLSMGIYGESNSKILRGWIDWNYSGLEAKELWPAYHELNQRLHGGLDDPRVSVEYSQEHEKAGSIRVYETVPFFSGRSTLEGVYNQASLQTYPVYYLASELNAVSPNPFRDREYSSFDTDNALRHLRLFNVGEIVALSSKLIDALKARSDVEHEFEVPPYSVFRVKDHGPGYVEPLAFAPVRSSPKGWRDKAYRWFIRKPQTPVHLVFSDDPRFTVVEPDEWLPPPAVPLEGGVEASATMEPEAITIHTNRPGHPLLVKVSYHPRWKAEGADGPYLVSPALMMVIPRQTTVRLTYGRRSSDVIGIVLSAVALGALGFSAWHRRRAAPPRPVLVLAPDPCAETKVPWRWGGLVPAGLVLLLAASRFVDRHHGQAVEPMLLYERASKAYSAERYEDASEYARLALARMHGPELRCLRGQSLLRLQRFREAATEFEAVLSESPTSPYVPEALFGAAQAHEAAGDVEAARAPRQRLLQEFGKTPWAQRLQSLSAGPTPPGAADAGAARPRPRDGGPPPAPPRAAPGSPGRRGAP